MEQNKSKAEVAAIEHVKQYSLFPSWNIHDAGIFMAGVQWQLEQQLKWKKIDPENLPTDQVLMKNSAEGCIVGIVEMWKGEVTGYHNYPCSEDVDDWALRQAEYYIPLSDLLQLEKES